MAQFLTELKAPLKEGSDTIYVLESPLIYESDIIMRVEVPAGFETDLASVPRIPLIYDVWGGRAHREATLHDYLYCIDSMPCVSFMGANATFFEAMGVRGKPWWVRYGMFWGVCLAGDLFYHKRKVHDPL